MTADFNKIQGTLLKLSRKQLVIVHSMVSDLIASIDDNVEARRKAALKKPRPQPTQSQQTSSWALPKFSGPDEEPDEMVMRSISPLSHIGSVEQMERICRVGVGHQLAQLGQVLDQIGAKHEHYYPDDDIFEEGEF